MITEYDLPEEYKDAMKILLGKEYPLYIESLGQKFYQGFRVNTLKVEVLRLLQLLGQDFQKITWVDTGFYLEEGHKMSKNPYYYAGLYYLQEPSAMTPASISKVIPGDKVLDLCAAPGGKSTQIASMLEGKGVLISNDISNSRAKALLKNIELSGIGNVMITCEEPRKLATIYEKYFDKVLVDAPCSGEGMFRKDKSVLEAYRNRGSAYFVSIQKEILESASRMVKEGGYLIYSTCTYSILEDEKILIDFLEKNPDFSIDPIIMEKGFTESNILKGTARLLPYKIQGEGHFISRLYRKRSIKNQKNSNPQDLNKKIPNKKVKLPLKVMEFLKHINREWDERRFYIYKEYIYYLPEDGFIESGIRYLRTGLLLGRIHFDRFEPSQALAMQLKMEEWDFPINFSIKDERVIRYLKGESLEISEEENPLKQFKNENIKVENNKKEKNKKKIKVIKNENDTYRLFCVDGFPLGFVKQSGLRLKNKYYPGWRWG